MHLAATRFKQEFSAALSPEGVVEAGAVVTIDTFDTYAGRVLMKGEAAQAGPRLPLTGPLAIAGCRPGDLLAVDVLNITCQQVGVTRLRSGSGLCPELVDEPGVFLHHIEGQGIMHPADCQSQLRPMIGCMGVAPAGGPVASNAPGPHGGNLDCPDLGSGSTLWLRVAVPQALLSLGDVHGRQGYGEFCGAAVEVGARVQLRVRVLPGRGEVAPWPLLVTGKEVAVLCSAPTLDAAAHLAAAFMTKFFQQARGCSQAQAYAVLPQIADLRICQVVNPLFTVGCYVPREYLAVENLLEDAS